MFASAVAIAQEAPSASLRPVQGQTLVSHELPRADLTFGKDFRYVGGQKVDLYGNADAEQHIFVVSRGRVAERFYWVQFEHFFPTNKLTYDYPPDHTTDIGDLNFIYDVKSWPQYASMQADDPASDGASIERLLNQHDLAFPQRVVRVRMFHLPTSDRRTELMIIYGEALSDEGRVPVRVGGVDLDKESPDTAHLFLEHARKDLKITKK
jgi:hypothetical protein